MPALNRFRNVGACTQQNSSGYVALRDRSLVHELGRESLRRLAWRCSEHHKRVGCAILSCSRPISRAEGNLDNRKTPWSEVRAVASHLHRNTLREGTHKTTTNEGLVYAND
jgi:hypothetical protein